MSWDHPAGSWLPHFPKELLSLKIESSQHPSPTKLPFTVRSKGPFEFAQIYHHLTHMSAVSIFTLPETDSLPGLPPENRPSQKKISYSNHWFSRFLPVKPSSSGLLQLLPRMAIDHAGDNLILDPTLKKNHPVRWLRPVGIGKQWKERLDSIWFFCIRILLIEFFEPQSTPAPAHTKEALQLPPLSMATCPVFVPQCCESDGQNGTNELKVVDG